MRKIVVLYSAEEGKYNNRTLAERLIYELANNILLNGKGNAIRDSERVTPDIARVQFKDETEILLYPITEYGLQGMKFTDIYIDNDVRNIIKESRMYVLTKIMPSLMDDRLAKGIYNYDKPIQDRLLTWEFCTKGGAFNFEEFMKTYADEGGIKDEK
jgi:hypothetical protein